MTGTYTPCRAGTVHDCHSMHHVDLPYFGFILILIIGLPIMRTVEEVRRTDSV